MTNSCSRTSVQKLEACLKDAPTDVKQNIASSGGLEVFLERYPFICFYVLLSNDTMHTAAALYYTSENISNACRHALWFEMCLLRNKVCPLTLWFQIPLHSTH
jgi:hypothetical protein